MSDRRRWLGVIGLVLLVGGVAGAHDMGPGAVSLREVAPGVFAVRVTTPRAPGGAPVGLAPEWPAGCAPSGGRLVCSDGLSGALRLPGLGDAQCLVAVQWLDGRRFEALAVDAEGVVIDRPRAGLGWLRAGVGHILLGPDHLLFVLGLVLVVRRRRALLVAITGFTVAHSLTLALAVLGVVAPAGAAVELLIAASVLLLAREAACEAGEGLAARWPIALVVPFGLLHGLGFAGALGAVAPGELGLAALALFNLGIELGQVAAVAVGAGALYLAPRARRPAAWGMGCVAGWWTLDRAAAWIGGLVG